MALEAQSGGHSKHALAVHLIWVVKYRRSVLTHEIGDRVKTIVSEVASEIGVEKKINLRLERAHLNILRMRDGRATLLCETCGEEVNRDKSRGAFSYTDGSTYCSQDCARKR